MEYLHQLSQSDLEVAQTTLPVSIDVRALSRALRLDSEFHHQNGGRRDHAQQPLDPLLVAYSALRKTETPALLVEKLLFDAEAFRVVAEDVREVPSEGDDVPRLFACGHRQQRTERHAADSAVGGVSPESGESALQTEFPRYDRLPLPRPHGSVALRSYSAPPAELFQKLEERGVLESPVREKDRLRPRRNHGRDLLQEPPIRGEGNRGALALPHGPDQRNRPVEKDQGDANHAECVEKDGRVQSDVDVFSRFRYQALRKRVKKEPGIDPRIAEPFAETPRPAVCARGFAELEGTPFVETRLFRQAESCHHRAERFYEPSVEKRSEVLIKEADDCSM